MRGRNVFMQSLVAHGVEHIFGNPGTTESPLIDERKITTGASISNLELEKIPSARDPWALLSQTPGVQTDRINVGGNESGQQSVFVAPGAGSDEVTWAVDGVNITDMSSLSSPSYFDFDAFEEVQFTTGGSDVSLESSMVCLTSSLVFSRNLIERGPLITARAAIAPTATRNVSSIATRFDRAGRLRARSRILASSSAIVSASLGSKEWGGAVASGFQSS